jgi:predicted  nucleic acid-binding Zn-ribbon protein
LAGLKSEKSRLEAEINSAKTALDQCKQEKDRLQSEIDKLEKPAK